MNLTGLFDDDLYILRGHIAGFSRYPGLPQDVIPRHDVVDPVGGIAIGYPVGRNHRFPSGIQQNFQVPSPVRIVIDPVRLIEGQLCACNLLSGCHIQFGNFQLRVIVFHCK